MKKKCGDPGLAVRNTRLWFTQRSHDQSVVAHNPNWIPKFTSITIPN